jgi:hypothetical protein
MGPSSRAGTSSSNPSEQARFDARQPPPQACAVLVPVWGAAFVRQFLDYCLPTLLAPNNLPALARALPTRFVLLAQGSDLPAVREHPSWQRLAQCCATQIELIDDLIADGNHHATVTLAYARALRATGEAMRDTVFVFLVGDYLVADGSLNAVLERITAGASGVLAGSLQIDADAARSLLRHRLPAETGSLALSARLLTGWALAHLPPTSAASIVDRSFLRDVEATRLFWSVDRDTLLGRFYLLHMIAIRPEVADFVVGAPCDYSFIPELCPSNNVAVLTDSDDYLVVEMQPHGRGSASLRRGPPRPAVLARGLSQWTTARHRQNAAFSLVFHAGDVARNITETEAQASAFIGEIAKRLRPAPQPHRDHPFWTGMMALQRAGAAPLSGEAWAHLLGAVPATGGLTGLLWRARLQLLGHPPGVTACHPRWPDFHLAYRVLKRRLDRSDRLLVLSATPRASMQWLRPLCETIESTKPDSIADAAWKQRSATFDACLWMIEPDRAGDGSAAIDRIRGLLKPAGRLLILVAQDPDAAPATTRAAAADLGLVLQRSGIELQAVHYLPGGAVRATLARALSGVVRAGRGGARPLLPLVLAAGALALAAIVASNLAILVRASKRPPRGPCSSVLIVGRPAPVPAKSAIDCQNARGYDVSETRPAGSNRVAARRRLAIGAGSAIATAICGIVAPTGLLRWADRRG